MIPETSILTILSEQVRTYTELHELLKRERSCLMEMDAARVQELSKEKDTLIIRLRLLEEERQRLIIKYSEEKGLGKDLNLEGLMKETGDARFGELRSRLQALLQGIEEMNQFNGVLLDRSLNYLKSTTTFLNIFKSDPAVQVSGSFLSKET